MFGYLSDFIVTKKNIQTAFLSLVSMIDTISQILFDNIFDNIFDNNTCIKQQLDKLLKMHRLC